MHIQSIGVLVSAIFSPLVVVGSAIAQEPASKLEYSAQRDLEYAKVGEARLLADIYQPNRIEETCPVILVVHGGAWRTGNKAIPGTYARMFAENGMAAVSISYRLAPEHKFPAQVDDMRRALHWIANESKARRWNVEKLGLFGYSAGAHLCSMIGTLIDEDVETISKTTLLPEGSLLLDNLPRPIAIVSGGTPGDFRSFPPENRLLSYFFGGTPEEKPEAYEFGSPARLASKGDVPTLFYHGTRDLVVPFPMGHNLYNRQVELGVESRFVSIDGNGHFLSFAHPTARAETLKFFREKLLSVQ